MMKINKKKKRKPVCTCHLAYGVGNMMVVDHPAGSSPSSYLNSQPGSSATAASMIHNPESAAVTHYPSHISYHNAIQPTTSQFSSQPSQYLIENVAHPPPRPPVPQQSQLQMYPSTSSNSHQMAEWTNQDNQYLTEMVQYRQNFRTIDPSMSIYQSQPQTYSPDLNVQRRLLIEPLQTRQRRWSDGNHRLSQVDQEYLAQQGLQEQQNYDSSKDFACHCNQCQYMRANSTVDVTSNSMSYEYGKPSKPRVSFGPSRMYPPPPPPPPQNTAATEVNPYDQQVMESMINLQNRQSPGKKSSKLTTELLPLDTQIPLQMMGDSALICRIM